RSTAVKDKVRRKGRALAPESLLRQWQHVHPWFKGHRGLCGAATAAPVLNAERDANRSSFARQTHPEARAGAHHETQSPQSAGALQERLARCHKSSPARENDCDQPERPPVFSTKTNGGPV